MPLKGKALHWHQAVMKDLNGITMDWKTYVEELEEHFQGGMITKPLISLRNLKLTSTVHEYNCEFNSLRNQVDLPNDVLIDLYLGGLPNELLHTIQLLDPKSISHAMRLARLQEGAYYSLWGLNPPNHSNLGGNMDFNTSKGSYINLNQWPILFPLHHLPYLHLSSCLLWLLLNLVCLMVISRNLTLNNHTITLGQLILLQVSSKKEFQLSLFGRRSLMKKERTINVSIVMRNTTRACRGKKVYMLICPDDDELELREEEVLNVETSTDINGQDEAGVTLSIHALLGSKSNKTLQLQGSIKKQKVLILVDSGSTNNFIDLSLAKKLGLKLIPIKKIDVSVADGFKVGVQFIC